MDLLKMEDETDEVVEIKLVAADIKKRFVDLKCKTQPGFNVATYADGKFDKYFEAGAKTCIALSASPEAFVNCQFRNGVDGSKIQPSFLTSDVAKSNYEKILTQDISVEDEYNVQIIYLRSQLYRVKRTVESALLDDDVNFTAWFRICISTEPIPSVIAKYKEKAREELKSNIRLLPFLKSKQFEYTRITN